MLVPIEALRTGARRLGAGDFNHRIDARTKDELEELAGQFNSMAGQLGQTYNELETKVDERTRDLAQSISELKVLEEVGRAVASSLDLNAVLPTVAARALEITGADAVLIYGYDAAKHQFNLVEAGGIDKSAEGRPLVIDEQGTILGEAAAKGEPSRSPTPPAPPIISCATSRLPPVFTRCWSRRWSISRACSARLSCCGARPANFHKT